MKKRLYSIFAVLVIASMACSLATREPPTAPTQVSVRLDTPAATPPPPTQVEPTAAAQIRPTPTPPAGVHGRPFAAYPSIPVRFSGSYRGGYALPLNLAAVEGVDQHELSNEQLALLSRNGFVVADPVPGEYQEFYQVYERHRYSLDQPVFATTDAVFHVYHLLFDKLLRDLETDHFIPRLEALTSGMLQASMGQYYNLQGTALQEPARRNAAFFGVGARLLELPITIPAEVNDLVQAELALIESHAGFNYSPVWDRPDIPPDLRLIEDYSQYVPRGHYTRSEALKRYFKTMMWYGRLSFRLKDSFETQRALLLVNALRSSPAADGVPAYQHWENIYEPTVFIVGKADDLSYHEYGVLSDHIFGPNPSLTAFADPVQLDRFIEAAQYLPPPQINSMWVWIWQDKQEVTQGFRLMGQRFTLDAYVFGQVIWRNVGTLQEPRLLPKGLDFFAALGSEEAYQILDELGETRYLNYEKQMAKVRQEVASLQIDTWTQNLYWSWLYAFQPVIEPKDERYPPFMQTTAWTRKDLHTALGSWTELKHDTILYAKQVMAEMGGGDSERRPPHGYVEPNPEAYGRLVALARMTYDGLDARGLLSSLTRGNLENLIDLLVFMKDISERELAGEPLTDREYWRIVYFGGELEALTLAAADCGDGATYCTDLRDQKAALVADVATGGDVLEEAIGQPTEIYVILPDSPWRVAVGAVFTYYEFTVPLSERMTDEAWQAWVEAGTTPPSPGWTRLFMAP